MRQQADLAYEDKHEWLQHLEVPPDNGKGKEKRVSDQHTARFDLTSETGFHKPPVRAARRKSAIGNIYTDLADAIMHSEHSESDDGNYILNDGSSQFDVEDSRLDDGFSRHDSTEAEEDEAQHNQTLLHTSPPNTTPEPVVAVPHPGNEAGSSTDKHNTATPSVIPSTAVEDASRTRETRSSSELSLPPSLQQSLQATTTVAAAGSSTNNANAQTQRATSTPVTQAVASRVTTIIRQPEILRLEQSNSPQPQQAESTVLRQPHALGTSAHRPCQPRLNRLTVPKETAPHS